MKGIRVILAVSLLALFAVSFVASAEEVIYVSEPTITDTPKMLPRLDGTIDRSPPSLQREEKGSLHRSAGAPA